jgi:hypothetical protein
MRPPRPAALLCVAALTSAALACQWVTGRSPTPTEPSTQTLPPLPSETEPAPADLTGTHWWIAYTEPGGTAYEYDLIFHPGGRLENSHPNETTPDNDAWLQTGDAVVLLFNDSYATYHGQIAGDAMTGTAVNITGAAWSWTAHQLP